MFKVNNKDQNNVNDNVNVTISAFVNDNFEHTSHSFLVVYCWPWAGKYPLGPEMSQNPLIKLKVIWK